MKCIHTYRRKEVAQIPINRPIWSHCRRLRRYTILVFIDKQREVYKFKMDKKRVIFKAIDHTDRHVCLFINIGKLVRAYIQTCR